MPALFLNASDSVIVLAMSTSSEEIPAYLATPVPTVSGTGPWPGVVIVHDVLGLSDDIRSIAGRFATAGYLAVAPDLYSRGGLTRCVRSVFRDLQRGSGRAFDDLDGVRESLANRPDCTGKVGIAGFCMGGGFALVAASRDFDASAPYYGMLPSDESILDGACPVVASFGKKDRMLPGAADKLRDALDKRDVPHDIKQYPDAGHSFANRMAGPFNALAQVMGFGYHHESTEDAWRRVLSFFGEHLS